MGILDRFKHKHYGVMLKCWNCGSVQEARVPVGLTIDEFTKSEQGNCMECRCNTLRRLNKIEVPANVNKLPEPTHVNTRPIPRQRPVASHIQDVRNTNPRPYRNANTDIDPKFWGKNDEKKRDK